MIHATEEVRAAQRAINAFSQRQQLHLPQLRVDGRAGAATRKGIRQAKHLLGYPRNRVGGQIGAELLFRLAHPDRPSVKFRVGPRQLRDGRQRRTAHRHHVAKLHAAARSHDGVVTFDGRPVAGWIVPYLVWARQHGWHGGVTSGYRTPEYSEHLCLQMCGAPRCPGRCAGRSTNHAYHDKPRGAVDVSYYAEFGELMAKCPLSPHLVNHLGAADPVHYSIPGN